MSSHENLPHSEQEQLHKLQKKKGLLRRGKFGAIVVFATSIYLATAAPQDVKVSQNENNALKTAAFETMGFGTAASAGLACLMFNYAQKELDTVDKKIDDINNPKRI